jgi:hypothetical protein
MPLLSTDEPPRLTKGVLGFDMRHADGRTVTVRIEPFAMQLTADLTANDGSSLRRRFERIARAKFMRDEVEADGSIRIGVHDLDRP